MGEQERKYLMSLKHADCERRGLEFDWTAQRVGHAVLHEPGGTSEVCSG